MGKIRSSLKPEPPASLAYLIEPHIDGALCNWGRWAAVREGRSQHANAMFRQALRGTRWEPSTTSLTPPDVDAAWRVEQTVCNPMFSPRFRTLLTEHYVHRRREHATCDLLWINRKAYDAELWKAATYFWERHTRRYPELAA